MAAPTETDLDVVQGQTFTMQVTWADETTDPATPISLSGYRAHMQVRLKVSAPTALLDLSSEDASPALTLEPGGQTGVLTVRIGATDTSKLTKSCVYDLFVVKKDDPTEATRLMFGTINVFRSVTVNS